LPTQGYPLGGIHSQLGFETMKQSLRTVALIAVGALYLVGQAAIAEQVCASGKHCATGKHVGPTTVGSATSGAGAGKIKGKKPELNPQPLPPGVKQPTSTGK
jgi:hypothetical protein